MAGGIFPGAPFRFNIKCIIFTAILAGGYWYLPHKNPWILALLLWLPYIALAWYDWSYDCRGKLGPTVVPFGRYLWLPFKPPAYQNEFNKMADEQIQTMNKVDHLVGWTIVVAGLVYILYKRKVIVR
jgi:hypothetical protein